MKRMRAVHLALASKLPTGVMLEEAPVLDSRYLSKILQRVALDHPDKYSDVVKTIGDIGRRAAYIQGESMGIADLRDPIDTRSMLAAMDSEVAGVKGGDPDERRAAVEDIWLRWAAKLERESMGAAKLKGNAVADSVASGARGKPLQLRAMLSTPAVFEDSLGKIVPIFARSSYSAGVSPTEMLAGTYGARKSVTATKTSTAKGGFWSKMVGQAAADVVVTEEDCGTQNGIDLDPSDTSLRNRVLAKGAVGLEPGSLLDRKAVATLQNKSKGPVIVRSALTCESKHGICAKCAGAQPDDKLPEIGFNAGITAAQALGEPVTQASLNCLVKGTMVRMADSTVKKIEDIQPGEVVLGADIEGRTFDVAVLHTWDQGLQPCYEYQYEDDKESLSLRSTADHKLLGRASTGKQKQKAGDAHSRTVLTGEGVEFGLVSVQPLGLQPCFDLTVDHPDELFVLANGLVVSNTKHLSGAASAKRQYSGLDWLARFVQVPDNFPDRAPLSEEEGFVSLEDAPQGGHYVRIGKSSHYVPQHLDLKVKNGQHVERGEQLSDGIVRPDDVVHTRGLGEGRRYYATRLKQMLDEGGTAASSRQTEIVARGAVNHVRLRDADDFKGYLPDDAVRYNDMLEQWEEAEDTEEKDPEASVGQFLQSPALHYTVGTRISPSMAKRLKTTGFSSVRVSSKEPPFADEMLRLQTQAYANTDWLASQHSSYLGRQLSDAARRGQDTKLVGNTHFAPALARGVDFGKQLSETGRY